MHHRAVVIVVFSCCPSECPNPNVEFTKGIYVGSQVDVILKREMRLDSVFSGSVKLLWKASGSCAIGYLLHLCASSVLRVCGSEVI